MQRSPAPGQALDAARETLEAMKAAKSFPELEQRWVEFLHRIDRYWNKAVAHFKKSPKWGGWCAPHVKAYDKDPLLLYLRQARNVDEHTIEPITDFQPGRTTINPLDRAGGLYVERLRFGPNGIEELKTDKPVVIEVTLPRTILLAVTNHGRTYPPPSEHMGKSLAGLGPVQLAELALDHYVRFQEAAENQFYR